MSDYHVNLGVHTLNAPARHDPRTAVVLGLPRSGTTMIAGTLHHLGVHMGDRLTATYEDLTLSGAVEQGRLGDVRRIVADRNDRSDVWGWKRPSSRKHIDLILQEFRNPYFVMVFRDPLAISIRKQVSLDRDVMWSLPRNVNAQKNLVDIAGKLDEPLLMLSYEKCVTHPTEAAESIASFMDVPLTDEAIAFIRPDGRA